MDIPADNEHSLPRILEELLLGTLPRVDIDELDFTTLEKLPTHFMSDNPRAIDGEDRLWRVRFRHQWLYLLMMLKPGPTPNVSLAMHSMIFSGLLYLDLIRRKNKDIKASGELPSTLFAVVDTRQSQWTAQLFTPDENLPKLPPECYSANLTNL